MVPGNLYNRSTFAHSKQIVLRPRHQQNNDATTETNQKDHEQKKKKGVVKSNPAAVNDWKRRVADLPPIPQHLSEKYLTSNAKESLRREIEKHQKVDPQKSHSQILLDIVVSGDNCARQAGTLLPRYLKAARTGRITSGDDVSSICH